MSVNRKLGWTQLPTSHGKCGNVRQESGIYSYGEVTRVDGLPIAVEWVYIGKSINLKKRIEQGHDAHREINPELWRWMGQPKKNRELWFAYVEIDNLDTVERSLISEIKPKFNRNLKK